ncbi:MAG: hypothetical protein M3P83_12025, partial [Actinomycetota bacterium]|nr:hypothetical protein [Actinomycetota bacterium]
NPDRGRERDHRPTGTRPSPITVTASSTQAGSYERIALTGHYPGGDGVTLQVQRREGGSWTAFPTSALVDGETYRTYVELGRPGPNVLRVTDPVSGRVSNVVVVRVS